MKNNKIKKLDPKNDKIWKRYTEELKTVDFSGHPIMKSSFNDINSRYGWNIDHILPTQCTGSNIKDNLQPVFIKTNEQKKDKKVFNIRHSYDDKTVITYCKIMLNNIKKKDYEQNYGYIFIEKQTVNNSIKIEKIHYFNEYGFFFDGKEWRHSVLDTEKSFAKKYLIFIHGNDPKKWPIKK